MNFFTRSFEFPAGFLCALALAATTSLSQAQPEPPTEIFALDTLTLEAARAADSARIAAAAALAAATAAEAGDTVQTESAVLPGTSDGNGSLSGRVVSEARGTVIAGARVIVAGRNLSTETDADGRFGFADLAPGGYSLFLYHGSYAPLTVDDIEVAPGRDASQRFAMPDKALQGEAVRITGTAGKAGEAGMLFAQKNAPTVSDGISAQQISKTPDSDAASALKRVTGISVGGDGLVYVRGLGERYVNMQLNGLTISSPNPEKRVVPLDLFPTRLLENLMVSKTFTADQPAEFAGGSLQLRTKDYPDKREIAFSTSVEYEPGSTFEDYYTYDGGSLDFLGIDDGARRLPGSVPDERFDHRSDALGATPEERQARQRRILASLPNVWTPHTATAPLNQSYGLTIGNKIPLGKGRTFGWFLGGSYSGKWSSDEEFLGKTGLNTSSGDTVSVYSDRYTKEIGTQSVKWGLLGTATLQDGVRHKLRFNLMLNRDWEDKVARVFGKREDDNDSSLLYEISTAQQTLTNLQVEGEHRPGGDEGFRVNWMAASTSALRWEPDRRVSKYFLVPSTDPNHDPDFPFRSVVTAGLRDRFWFDLQERGWGGKVDVEKDIEGGLFSEGSRLKGGVFVFLKNREYDVRRLSYVVGSELGSSPLRYGPYEGLLGVFNGASDSGYVTNIYENEKDDYTVRDLRLAAYVQSDWALTDGLRLITGVRLVRATVEGEAQAQDGTLSPPEDSVKSCNSSGRCTLPFGYDQVGLLPAVSAVYSLTGTQNLRLSYTRTSAYPEYREMAPLLFYSYQDALEVYGNVRLKPTDIQNYDLRWEWFPSTSEMFAASVFYKYFRNPVETRISVGASNDRALFENASSADLYGIETEARLELDRIHEMLDPFQLIGNFTWIRSEVEGERRRAMQGQSPYLINAILFAEFFEDRTQMSLLYNRFERRLAKVGVTPFPDVYEEARESLEFAYNQKWGDHLKSKVTIKNLTDAAAVQTQGGLVTRRSRPGRTYSVGVTYAF